MPVNWPISLLLMHLLHFSMGDNVTECGTAEVMPSEAQNQGLFIIGGKNVPHRTFPWVGYLSLKSQDKPMCTVSLISAYFVVTAAHCVKQIKCPNTTITVFGTVSMKGAAKKYIYKNVRIIYPKVQHVKVNGTPISSPINDIALIELEKDVDISGSKGAINVLCLPSPDMEMSGKLFLVGWGATVYNSHQPSEVLKYMISNIMNKTTCEKDIPALTKFCVKGVKAKETPYRGDSGGPALKLIDGRYYLYGVLHGKERGENNYRSFYTNVFEFLDWIKRHPEKDTEEIRCKN